MKSRNLFLIVAAAMLIFASAADAQPPACSLLTPSDIEVATGVKPGASHQSESTTPESMTMHICRWQSGLTLSITRFPAGSAEAAMKLIKHNPGVDALRAAHWTEEEKDFGNAYCVIMTPPASQTNQVMMSSCSTWVKGMILSVVFLSPTKKLSIGQTKALLDKAIGRLR